MFCFDIPNPLSPKVARYQYLIDYFRTNPSAIQHNSKPKNLLLFIVESFELQNLGPYNKDYKNLMPYLSNLSQHSTIFTNILPDRLLKNSISSQFCALCGFPVLFTGKLTKSQGHVQMSPFFKCIPDYLKMLNYTNYYIMTGNWNVGNVVDFAKLHNFKIIDSAIHHGEIDHDVASYTANEFIPNLDKDKPFFIAYSNIDTHFGRMPNACMKKTKRLSIQKQYFNEFNCFDSYLKRIITSLKKNDLYDNTEIVIYGDHFYMSSDFNFVEPRRLTIILPKHNYGIIDKKMSYYDMTHLILGLMNISVTPEFPLGSDPLSPNHTFYVPNRDVTHALIDLFFRQLTPELLLRNITGSWTVKPNYTYTLV